jgi:hypothetical protein
VNRIAGQMPSMSDAASILGRCCRLGLKLWAEGDRIGIAPRGRIPPDLREQIRAAKPELLPVLREGVGLPSDCVPWLHVALQILAGEFDGCDSSTCESLTIGLRSIAHPLCREALERLRARTRL